VRSRHTRAAVVRVGGALAGAGLLVWLALAAFAVPDQVRIPKTRPHPPGAPQARARFSHWGHGAYRCFACHPGIFPQELVGFTHADMNQGRFCGCCHDGREAKAVAAHRCESCHAP
jgi:c(7)-type cytochrome triheme protein